MDWVATEKFLLAEQLALGILTAGSFVVLVLFIYLGQWIVAILLTAAAALLGSLAVASPQFSASSVARFRAKVPGYIISESLALTPHRQYPFLVFGWEDTRLLDFLLFLVERSEQFERPVVLNLIREIYRATPGPYQSNLLAYLMVLASHPSPMVRGHVAALLASVYPELSGEYRDMVSLTIDQLMRDGDPRVRRFLSELMEGG